KMKSESISSLIALKVENPPGRKEEIKIIRENIKRRKDVILLGARRVGKTTLLNAIEKIEKGYEIIRYDCMEEKGNISALFTHLFAYSKKPKIFVSSVGRKKKEEVGKDREAAEEVIKENGCDAFLIENSPSTDKPIEVEEENIKNSDAFLLILGNKYSKNVKDEYEIALAYDIPVLCMIKGEKDENRDSKIKEIIEEIKKKEERIYNRYNNIEEFRKNLEKSIKEKVERWRSKRTTRFKNVSWKDAANEFFEELQNAPRNKEFLFVIDELGELRKKNTKKDDDFEDMLGFISSKISQKPNNNVFIFTGSENVFTLHRQKYFSNFHRLLISPFKKDVAAPILKQILSNMKIDNNLLNKTIEICGCLPHDLQLFASKLIEIGRKEAYEEDIINATEKVIRENGKALEDAFLEYLDEESKKFIRQLSLYLPLSKDEIGLSLQIQDDKLNKFIEKVAKHYFILEEREDNKYWFVSNLLQLWLFYDTDSKKFHEKIKNIVKKENGKNR
ncbi:MAG: hypothetical protein CVT89_05135, partial [Candidatus Altiarchaeales archaeon HGW-Altiarchaeales-2]